MIFKLWSAAIVQVLSYCSGPFSLSGFFDGVCCNCQDTGVRGHLTFALVLLQHGRSGPYRPPYRSPDLAATPTNAAPILIVCKQCGLKESSS